MILPGNSCWLDESNRKFVTSLSQGKVLGILRSPIRSEYVYEGGARHTSVRVSGVSFDLDSKTPIGESFLDYFSIEEILNGVIGTATISSIDSQNCTMDEIPKFVEVGGWKYEVDKDSLRSTLKGYNNVTEKNLWFYNKGNEFHMDINDEVNIFLYPSNAETNITDISYSLSNQGIVDIKTEENSMTRNVSAKAISSGKTTLTIEISSQFAGVKETKECTREIEVHSWNDGVEEEKATCEFEGIIRHTCKYCNQTKAEFTAALGHDFETEWTIDENEGIMYHVCKRDGCGVWSDLTPIPTATPTAKPTVPPTTKPTSTPVPSPSATQTAAPTKAPINSKEQAATKIADNAFKGDRKLTEIKIDSNITEIGKNAFRNCKKLKKITLPQNVKKLGAYAFSGCKKLKTLTIKNRKLKAKDIAKNAFKGISKSTVIKVPKGKVSAYRKLFRSKGLSKKVKVKEY